MDEGSQGGALVFHDSGVSEIETVTLRNNSAIEGGAVYITETSVDNFGPTSVFCSSTTNFDTNVARERGGAVMIDGSANTLEAGNSNFNNNKATNAGESLIGV